MSPLPYSCDGRPTRRSSSRSSNFAPFRTLFADRSCLGVSQIFDSRGNPTVEGESCSVSYDALPATDPASCPCLAVDVITDKGESAIPRVGKAFLKLT